jgi:dienelactone hydrolase
MCTSFSMEIGKAGRRAASAAAILLAALTPALAQAPQANAAAPAVRVVASKAFGPWTINGFSTGFCMAERTLPITSGGATLNYAVARIPAGLRLIVSAQNWALTPGASFPIELNGSPAFRNDTSATAIAPKIIAIELGANRELMLQFAALPSIQVKTVQAVFTLPLDVLQPAFAELEACFEERTRALSNPFAAPAPARPAAPATDQGARPAQPQGSQPSPATTKQVGELVEERTFLTIRNNGGSYRLEALVVRPAKASGRLPVALITHGKPATAQEMLAARSDMMLPQARDLAERGWLAVIVIRRGFGQSGGVPGVARGSAYTSCVNPDLGRAFEMEAEDLEEALKVIAERPDADGSRAIAIGVSVGGGTVLALAARQPKGLRAVINVSGGVRRSGLDGKVCDDDALPSAMTGFGARTTVPTLWLYAENDSLFGPDLVRRMREAYARAGGRVDMQMFPALQQDGHALFADLHGRIKWLAALDKFLRTNDLPSWNVARIDVVMKTAKLDKRARNFVGEYLALPTQKALAVSANGVPFWHVNSHDLAQARDQVLARCREKSGHDCAVVMTNSELAAPATASVPGKQAAAAN